MAHVPGRRNRPVADATIAQTPVVPYQDNNAPYNHDDENVEAEYADTVEEFNSYDDPDSVQDILRDKPEQFYVGNVADSYETKTKVIPFNHVAAGAIITTGAVELCGIYSVCVGKDISIGLYDGINPGQDLAFAYRHADTFSEHFVSIPIANPILFSNGLSIKYMIWSNANDPGEHNFAVTIVYRRKVS